jgi:hypothetical protein
MSTMVTIQVRLDDGDTTQKLAAIDTALAGVGVQGSASIKQAGAQVEQLGGHATTALDNVRLLSQEFGIRLPRAMESALSRFPQVTAALGAFSTGLLAIGGAEVFVHLAEEGYELYEKFLSLTSASDKLFESLKKTATLDFSNTHSIETTVRRANDAQQTYSSAPGAASSLSNSGWDEILTGNVGVGVGLLAGATAGQQLLDLGKRQIDQQHQAAVAAIDLAHAKDSTLQKEQQLTAEAAKQRAIHAEDRAYDTKLDKFYGNAVPADAGAAQQTAQDQQTTAETAAKQSDLALQTTAALVKARGSAAEAGLTGEALYAQKLQDSLAALHAQLAAERNLAEYSARAAALRAQSTGEETARLRELNEQTQHMEQEATGAGKTGAARILSEGDAKLQTIDTAQENASGGAPLSNEQIDDFYRQRQAVAAETNAQLSKLEDDFSDHVRSLQDGRAASAQSAFAKITAAATVEKDALAKMYNEDFANASLTDEQKQQAHARYAAGVAAIDADAAAKTTEQRQRNAAEDLQFDQESAAAERRVRSGGITGWVQAYRAGIQEIEAQEAQRIAKLEADAQREGLSAEEVERRRQDIVASGNAAIAESNQQLQHTIAGQLQQAFTSPEEYIKSRMQQMMFDIIADWLLQSKAFQAVLGTTIGNVGHGAANGGGISIGSILGVGAGHAASAGTSAAAGVAGAASGGVASIGAASGGAGTDTGGGISTGHSAAGSDWAGTASSVVSAAQDFLPSGHGGGGFSSAGDSSTGDVINTSFADAPDATMSAGSYGMDDNGEGGGFAGSMIGDPADAVSGDNSIASQAGQQVGTLDADTASAGTSGAGAALTDAGLAAGAYQGGKGVYDSFFQSGAKGLVDGTLSGATAGAAIGTLILPGVGTVVGGVIGATAGFAVNATGQITGEGSRIEARKYYRQSIFPELEGIDKTYSMSGGDYLSAVSQANDSAHKGYLSLQSKFGGEAADWVRSIYIDKELTKVTTDIARHAGGGAAYMGRQAAEFHGGGTIRSFHDYATSPNEGFIHAMLGEGVVNSPAMSAHAPFVGAMNSGADHAEMAAMYMQAATPRGGASTSSSTSHSWSVNALDSRSFEKFLDGGGNEAVVRSTNRFVAKYAGDGIHG